MANDKKTETATEPTLLERMQAQYPDKEKVPEPCADCPNMAGFGTDEKKD